MTNNKVCFFQKGSIEIVDGKGTHEFPYHTHESFMIGVVKSGEARFVIGNNEYILGKGMTYLVVVVNKKCAKKAEKIEQYKNNING